MDHKLLVFAGRASQEFTKKVCKVLNSEIGTLEAVNFSDGEINLDIKDNVRGRDVFIIQSTSTPCNDHIMELLIILDALKRSSASRITAVIPYYGYARQDRKVKPRVPITAKLMADLITRAGAHRVLTMDLHSGQIMGFFDIPVDNLNALPILYPYIREKYGKEKITIVSPDAGGVERARIFASRMPDANIAVIDKRRPAPGQIAEMRVVGEVEGRVCVVIDDMIDTGGTIIKAGETLLKDGATKVIACAVHGVLSGDALQRLSQSSFEEVVITDTITQKDISSYPKIKVLSVTPLFAEAIRRIHNEDSISSLFK